MLNFNGADIQPGSQTTRSPLVSVILPTCNRLKLLVESIRSILRQTFQDFEVIIVNDGGEDVRPIVQGLQNGKLSLRTHAQNAGPAAARNTGLRMAQGKYIAYLDDDDMYYPDHLGTLVAFLENNPVYQVAYTDALYSHQEKVGEQYVEKSRQVRYSSDFDQDQMLLGNYIPMLCVFHRKDCLDQVGNFDETLLRASDWDMWLRMSRTFGFAHIKQVTCQVRWLADASSLVSKMDAQKKMWMFSTLTIYSKQLDLLETRPRISELIHSKIDYCVKVIRALLLEGLLAGDHAVYKEIGVDDLDLLIGRFRSLMGQLNAGHSGPLFDIISILSACRANDPVLDEIVIGQVRKVRDLEARLEERELELAGLTRQVAEILESRTWKTGSFFHRLSEWSANDGRALAKALRQARRTVLALFAPAQIQKERELEADLGLIRSSGLFNENWYLRKNPDVAQKGLDALSHYVKYGALEGRDPGPNFSEDLYLQTHPELRQARINPLVHYLRSGKKEDWSI